MTAMKLRFPYYDVNPRQWGAHTFNAQVLLRTEGGFDKMDIFEYDIVQFSSNVTVDTVTVMAENLDDADIKVKESIPDDCTFFLSGVEIGAKEKVC